MAPGVFQSFWPRDWQWKSVEGISGSDQGAMVQRITAPGLSSYAGT